MLNPVYIMKKFYTLLVVCASVTAISAQIHKGSVLLGGTVGFNNVGSDGSSVTTVSLAPKAAFFLSNHFALGGEIDLSLVAANGANATTLDLGPFARYYFNGSGNARFFGQASVGFESSKVGDFGALNSLSLGVGLGVDFFLNNNVAIEGFLGYQHYQYLETDLPIDTDGFNVIGLNFGVAAFIGREKD